MPGARFGKLYSPAAVVVADRDSEVPWLVSVTSAPGTPASRVLDRASDASLKSLSPAVDGEPDDQGEQARDYADRGSHMHPQHWRTGQLRQKPTRVVPMAESGMNGPEW